MKTIHVVAAVIRKGNQIFATQRGYGEFQGGWEFPGGKVEEDETSEEALANNYLKQRRDEFDVFFYNGRVGYRNRKPTKAVQRLYENWDQIRFDKLTCIVKAILDNLSDQEIMKMDDSSIIMIGLQS